MRIIECFSLVCCQFSGQEYRGAHMWGSREKAQQFFGRRCHGCSSKRLLHYFLTSHEGDDDNGRLATSLPSFLLLCLQTRESSSRRNFPFSKCSLKIHGKERTFWFHFFFALWVYRTFFSRPSCFMHWGGRASSSQWKLSAEKLLTASVMYCQCVDKREIIVTQWTQ